MNKKLFPVGLCLSLMLGFSSVAFAQDSNMDYANMSNLALANLSGIPVKQLEYAREYYGDNFAEVISEFMSYQISNKQLKTNDSIVLLEDATEGIVGSYNPTSRITAEHWDFISETFKPGQILLTDDAAKTFGHVGMLRTETHTVEHKGKDSELSGCYDVRWWKNFDTMKTFNYISDSDIMGDAATYAYNNLQGLEYNLLSDKEDTEKVNCATLVWKAYDSQGVNVVDDEYFGTIRPQAYDDSTKIEWVRSVGWNNVNW